MTKAQYSASLLIITGEGYRFVIIDKGLFTQKNVQNNNYFKH